MPAPERLGGTVAARFAEVVGDRSQGAVAELVGVTRQTINRWLKGHRTPDAEEAKAIERAFGVNASWLLYGQGPKRPRGNAGADAYRSGYLAGLEWAQGQLSAEIMRLRAEADAAGLRDLGTDGTGGDRPSGPR